MQGRNQMFHLFFLIWSSSNSTSGDDFVISNAFADPEVLQKLRFAKQPSSLTRVTGQNAVFPCVAVGFPTPYIRWTRNEEELITEGWVYFYVTVGIQLELLFYTTAQFAFCVILKQKLLDRVLWQVRWFMRLMEQSQRFHFFVGTWNQEILFEAGKLLRIYYF